MPWTVFFGSIAVLALIGAVVLLIFGVRAAWRRRWSSVLQLVSALCLLGLVALLIPPTFGQNTPHAYFNGPAPISDTASVYAITDLPQENHPYSPMLFAADGRTGILRWQQPITEPHGKAMDVGDGESMYTAEVGNQNVDLSALDGVTGALRWHVHLPLTTTYAAPVVSAGTLIIDVDVVGGDSGSGVQQSDLLAFSTADGHQLWKEDTTKAHDITGQAAGTANFLHADDGIVYVEAYPGTLQAWRIADSHLLWARPDAPISLVSGADAVFELDRAGAVTALDAQTGATLWLFGEQSGIYGGAFAQDTLYVISAGPQSFEVPASPVAVHALDPRSGHVRWQYDIQPKAGATLVAGPDSIFVNTGASLLALRSADGKLIWRVDTNDFWSFAPLSPMVGTVLYVTQIQDIPSENVELFSKHREQTFLYAFDQKTGSIYWKAALGPVVTVHDLWTL